MIDSIESLAFAIHSNRGSFALLLGSGVSRSAQIPTGWEITLDLVRKVAQLKGEDCGSTPEEWYRQKFGKEPNYSDLIAELAKTPTERQQLLRSYFEPSEEERTQGIKTPSPAHQAIARLVQRGYIRVIITTNFDRLIEKALSEVGVEPTVISTPNQLRGTLPLVHIVQQSCLVLKLHGDYLDVRIRNTPEELESYPKELNEILDRILDEFGLIVCGWSAEWDTALRASIERTQTRRFSHFWAVRGEPSESARRLITHRQAQVIKIQDADSFFTELLQKVESLEAISRPHPLSVEMAVATLKKYLAKQEYRIQLDDLVTEEVEQVKKNMSEINKDSVSEGIKTFTERIRAYDAACEKLIAMGLVGGYWIEDWHCPTWQKALRLLAAPRSEQGNYIWVMIQSYPATLLLYALGIGVLASSAERIPFLGKLFSTRITYRYGKEATVVERLLPFCYENVDAFKRLEGKENFYAPLNEWVRELMSPKVSNMFPDKERYNFIFSKLELLMSLSYGYHAKRYEWFPPGVFGYPNREDIVNAIISEIARDIDVNREESPFVAGRLFGDSPEDCLKVLERFLQWIKKLRTFWW